MTGKLMPVAAIAAAALACACSRPRDPPLPRRPAAAAPVGARAIGLTVPALDSVVAAAESLYLRGEFDSARALWSGALAQARITNDSIRQGRTLTWLGLTAYRKGNYFLARTLGERALALERRLQQPADLARSYLALGLIAWNEGRLDAALDLFRRASDVASTARDEAMLAKAANNLALVQTELGEFAQARAGFLSARRAGARIGDPRIEGGALANLGMLEVQLGDPRAAIEHLARARALYRVVGFEIGEQNALGQLGTAYDALGEPGLAYAALDSALQLSRKHGLRQEEASNLELVAGLYREAGDLPRALRLFGEANRLNGELGLEVEQGTNLRSAAEIQLALGRADLARPHAEEALHIHRAVGARPEELRDLLLLADLAAREGDDVQAGDLLRTAGRLAVGLGARTARIEVALARATIADRTGSAERVLAVLRVADPDLSRGGYGAAWLSASLQARAFARLSQLDSAASAGRAAVSAVERARGSFGSGYLRSTYAADKSAPYDELVDVLLRLDRTGEALEVADAARSRALLEHLAAAGNGIGVGHTTVDALSESEALLRRIDSLVSRLDAVEETPAAGRDDSLARARATQLAEARGAYEALLVRAAERDAAGAALLGGRRASAEEIRRALRENEALVEYYVAPERVIAFVVTNASVQSLAIAIRRPDLAARARLARELLGRRDQGAVADEILSTLHDLLVAPLERAGLLRGTRRLVVVPHAVLAYVPFAALRSATSGRYLMEDYAVLHLPSAAALAALREDRSSRSPGHVRGVAIAPFPDALPASRREVRAFQRALGAAEAFEGASATERRLRDALASNAVVHVATHGAMNPRNPMFSRIELARGGGDPADDGRLEVHEVLALGIHAPIVFLSGCETGVGAAWSTGFAQGEDYATLAQAFLYAGAGSVVATLWRIGDEGAAAFAERFYARVNAVEPAEALAEAQRAMLADRRYASPYYWAAYQVSGDGQPRAAHKALAGAVQRP
jgi:CHAT domain-containing protein/tetratricopeptide (TPR) repeat protein